MTTVHRTCPLCEAVCGLTLTLDDGGHVTSVRGDKDDPFSKGFICPKGASLGKLDEDPERLTKPVVREGDTFREASWEEAFELVRQAWSRVADRQSSAIYLGNPSAHSMAGALYATPLIKSLGTRNIYSASTADQMPKHVACGLMYGDPLSIPVPDLDRTDYLLMLGANPMESNGSLCTAPDFPGRLKALRRRGGKVVVVDPRRTRTADKADEHVFVRPGTDAYLLFGLVHTLFAEELLDIGLEVNGLDQVEAQAKHFPPDVVARRTGVPAETVVRLARELAAAERAVVYARIGTCTQEYGTLAQWLVDVLNVLTGNLDRPGGAMFPMGATEFRPRRKPYRTGRWSSRVRQLPEANGELPVATLADEIETPGEGQVRFLITVGGNPVMSAPNGARLDKAFEQLDFMVSVDPWLNDTTRHANVILPPPRLLQSGHFDFALQGFAVRNYTRYSRPVLPLGERPSESEILARLTQIITGLDGDLDEFIIGQTPGAAELELEGESGAERRLDMMLKLGPYEGLSLRTLLDNPHGIDLGPLQPRLPGLLKTGSGRVELAPPQLIADVERLLAGLDSPMPDLVLIGRRHLRSNNSWMHLTGGSNTYDLHIHPSDATRLGLDGSAVVRSAAGELTVTVRTTDAIMPGVVSLPHGWREMNVNVLTDETAIDVPSGNAVFNGVPVTVSVPEVINAH
ncbi:molybdopterin-dependent oxidoreductase [Nonomuraea sp. NPDC050663]|uniref:molybdopterin-dependent oxidoreductase n=1 Tax=Nonomuraea sp. NPDC050663 TaxID=3364370 RepID=UPI0037AA6A27